MEGMSIGLVEMANHNEVLRSYIIALLKCKRVNRLMVFTHQQVYDQVYDLQAHNKIQWIIKAVNQSTDEFIESRRNEIDHCDLVIYTTMEDDHSKIIEAVQHDNLAIVLHKGHLAFAPFANIDWMQFLKSFKAIGRLLKMLWKLKGISDQLAKSKFVIVPDQIVCYYLDKINKRSIKLVPLPFAVNEEYSKIKTGKEIHIVIPGSVSDKSRDYQIIYQALVKIAPPFPVKLTLLGNTSSSYAKKIIKRLKEIDGLKLIYYDHFISQKEFDAVMRSADFLILPMQKMMKFGITQEKNGFSCVSGNINDMVKYGIPSIIPSFYPMDDILKPIIADYQNEEQLTQLLEKWILEKTYNSIKEDHMEEVMEAYSKMHQDMVESLIDEVAYES